MDKIERKELDGEIVLKNLINNSIGENKKVKKKFKIKKAIKNITIIALISMIISTSLSSDKTIGNNNFEKESYSASLVIKENLFEELKNIAPVYYDSNYFDSIDDSQNVYVNNVIYILTNYIKGKLTEKEYSYLCKNLEGKKLKEIINSDGAFNVEIITDSNILTLTQKEKEIMKNKIMKIKFYKDINFYKDSILESTIKEIVTDKSGFDAVVLEKDNDYFIINTCCGENEKEDIMSIIYDIVNRLIGNEDFYEIATPILFGENAPYEIPKEYGISNDDIMKAKYYYNGQRIACCELIKRYILDGKNIKLGGYSLGGGIMLDSYIALSLANPKLCSNINISLYNPYIGFAEGNNSINEIKKFSSKYHDNIKIYSAEGDVVSQFNNIIDMFGDSVKYLKGNKEIDYNLKDLNVIKLIGSEESRHSVYGVDYSSFDKIGNILEQGKQITLNEIANGTIKSNSLEVLFEDAFKENMNMVRETIYNVDLKENEYMREDIINMYDSLLRYFQKNVGNIDYDSVIDVISPSITNIMHKTVEKKVGWFKLISNIMNSCSNEKKINVYMKGYFLSYEGKIRIGNILNYLLTGDLDNTIKQINNLGTIIYLKADRTGINEFIYNISGAVALDNSDQKTR